MKIREDIGINCENDFMRLYDRFVVEVKNIPEGVRLKKKYWIHVLRDVRVEVWLRGEGEYYNTLDKFNFSCHEREMFELAREKEDRNYRAKEEIELIDWEYLKNSKTFFYGIKNFKIEMEIIFNDIETLFIFNDKPDLSNVVVEIRWLTIDKENKVLEEHKNIWENEKIKVDECYYSFSQIFK